MKILIADDDAVSRRLLQSYLQKWGYDVTAAGDGDEAWRLFEVGGFPAVISDWMMPGMDGPALIRRIRSSPRPGYVYAILLTAKSQKEDLVQGMDAGADDFLTKPFDRDELRVRLRAGERIIRLEQNVRETQVALIQSEKLAGLGRMAAGVAHEINNPLAFVVNNLRLLRRDVSDVLRLLEAYRQGRESPARETPALAAEAARVEGEIDLPYLLENFPRLFDRTDEGLRRVRAIVQNLRDFARLDEAEYQEVDINAALRSTLEVLGHELDKKAIRVVTAFQEVPRVSCCAAKLDQAFLNILLNAIQASPRDAIVEVRTQIDGDRAVVVEIEDHGVGIPPENLPHIFEPFFTTRPVGAGTGLGLSVSYGVIREQGGTIEAESIVDRGSLFRVRFPSRPPLRSQDLHAIAPQ